MVEFVQQYWAVAVTTFVIGVSVVLSASVILYKRNERAAIAWVGLIILSPIIGSIAYLLLGINRIKRRAVRVRPHAVRESAMLASAVHIVVHFFEFIAGTGALPGADSGSNTELIRA